MVWHKYKGRNIDKAWFYMYSRNSAYFYFKNMYAQNRATLPSFLFRLVWPPRDYALRSGVRLGGPGKVPGIALAASKGILNGWRAARARKH